MAKRQVIIAAFAHRIVAARQAGQTDLIAAIRAEEQGLLTALKRDEHSDRDEHADQRRKHFRSAAKMVTRRHPWPKRPRKKPASALTAPSRQ